MERKDAIAKCMCRACPSFVKCDEAIAYCLAPKGKSKCIKQEMGCFCPGCPVQANTGFKHVYYCIRGSERDLTAKK